MALKDVVDVKRNEDGIAATLSALQQQLGDKFQMGEILLRTARHTMTYLTLQAPDGVVFAENPDDVKSWVKACAQYKLPIIQFETVSSLEEKINV